MNAVADIVPHGAIVIASMGAGACFALGAASFGTRMREVLSRHAKTLDEELAFLRLPVRGLPVAIAQIAVSGVSVVVAWATSIWPLGAFAVTAFVAPKFWLDRRRAARVLALEEQLADWLVSVSSALQAGNPIAEALRASAQVTGGPMRDEVEQTLREFSLGAPLDVALSRLGRRVRSRSVSSAIFILSMGRETGGDLPATLQRAADSLREMARLEGVIRTKTAEGKAQAFVISVIPAPLIGVIDWMSPGYFAPLSQSGAGYAVCAGAAVMWTVAIVLASRIIAVEV